jgi:hypothetical protein
MLIYSNTSRSFGKWAEGDKICFNENVHLTFMALFNESDLFLYREERDKQNENDHCKIS